MATSKFEICKQALARLGTETNFTSFGDNTPEARLLDVNYDPVRRAILRAHPWSFAIKRADLALETTTPSFEYTYSFTLPSDFLAIRRTSLEAQGYDHDYRIEGGKMLADDTVIKIEYIADIEDVALFDPLFEDIVAQRLAAELAAPLSDNATLTERLWDVYERKLLEARSVDAQGSGRPRDIVADKWIMSRQ